MFVLSLFLKTNERESNEEDIDRIIRQMEEKEIKD